MSYDLEGVIVKQRELESDYVYDEVYELRKKVKQLQEENEALREELSNLTYLYFRDKTWYRFNFLYDKTSCINYNGVNYEDTYVIILSW